jgi:6-phospho-beta-glucosidase
VRLAIVGGGGFRVPLVYRALLADDHDDRVTDLVLHDTDPTRLRAVGRVLEGLAARVPGAPRVHAGTDLDEALRGSDFVFSAIRVGGLAGRVCDERSALAQGVLGQETTGAGGVTYGLRTVPVAVGLARTVRRVAPEAWVINFTNPAGMVTQAMAHPDGGGLGGRVVGICDSPVGMMRRVAHAVGVDPDRARFDYAGLNHLGWLRRVEVDGRDLLPGLLADDAALLSIEEGGLFGPDWLRTLGAVPNEYLWYWYYTAEAVAAAQQEGRTRGEYLSEQQGSFYAEAAAAEPAAALAAWERTRHDREATYMAGSSGGADGAEDGPAGREAVDLDGGGYDRMALELMRAIAYDEPATMVLNVAAPGVAPGLADDAVVEVPCTVDAAGPRPLPLAPLDGHQLALVQSVKAVETTTIEAALTGSQRLALRALATHPLVDSVTSARAILDAQLAAVPALRAVLLSQGPLRKQH